MYTTLDNVTVFENQNLAGVAEACQLMGNRNALFFSARKPQTKLKKRANRNMSEFRADGKSRKFFTASAVFENRFSAMLYILSTWIPLINSTISAVTFPIKSCRFIFNLSCNVDNFLYMYRIPKAASPLAVF